jgi:hypothetical protein
MLGVRTLAHQYQKPTQVRNLAAVLAYLPTVKHWQELAMVLIVARLLPQARIMFLLVN